MPDVCVPACQTTEHCAGGACIANECAPACQVDEVCTADGECVCNGGSCMPSGCEDGEDNDLDGWIDAEDPDCAHLSEEIGSGSSGCNDGLDNDGDGQSDADDIQCDSGGSDEVLGSAACSDACAYGATLGSQTCSLYDAQTMSWSADGGLDEGPGNMHHRSRGYDTGIIKTYGIFRRYLYMDLK